MKRLTQLASKLAVVAFFALSFFAIPILSLSSVGAAPEQARTTQNVIVNLSPQVITTTGTAVVTPTKSFLLFSHETGFTATLSAGGALQGDTLKLGSDVVTETIIAATNTSMASSATISQNDVLTFLFFNGQWVLDNSIDNAPD